MIRPSPKRRPTPYREAAMIDLMHGIDADLDDLDQYVGYYLQEKYRGVRLVWGGRAAWSRQGVEVELPSDWYESMPTTPLDAELYDGVDGERRCASAIRFGPKHFTKTMRIIAFDAPGTPDEPWEVRNVCARNAVEFADFDRIEWAPYSRVKSVEAMLASLQEVHDRQGEGLILRKPGSLYQSGYSDNIIKLKHAF
jgi:DNA ligase 1